MRPDGKMIEVFRIRGSDPGLMRLAPFHDRLSAAFGLQTRRTVQPEGGLVRSEKVDAGFANRMRIKLYFKGFSEPNRISLRRKML